MDRRRILATLGIGLLWLAATPALARDATPAPALTYLVRTTGGAAADATLPMVIAVHGLGDRAESFARLFDTCPSKLRVVIPRAPIPHGRGGSWFRIERPPGAAMVADMRAATTQLAQLARTVARRYPTRGKPVITGFSQGGMLSYALAVTDPAAIRGAIPIAGMLPRALWPKRPPIAPVIALHGAADRRVPYSAAEALVVHLVDLGADARLTPFVGVGHRIPQPLRAAAFAAIDRLTR